MTAKRAKPQKSKRPQSHARPPQTETWSMRSVVMQNLINMLVVTVVSGTVLLALLAARHF